MGTLIKTATVPEPLSAELARGRLSIEGNSAGHGLSVAAPGEVTIVVERPEVNFEVDRMKTVAFGGDGSLALATKRCAGSAFRQW